MVAESTVMSYTSLTIVSLPAVRVVFNHVTGRKKWHKHDDFSAVMSMTTLIMTTLLTVSYVITQLIMSLL
jgi:hypothetical protein